MTKVTHVTDLTKHNTCAFNAKYDDSAILPNSTYKGDLLNINVLNHTSDNGMYLERYMKHIDWDFKSIEMIKEILQDVNKYIKDLKKKNLRHVWQECKMLLPMGSNRIVWTPDLIYYNPKEWYVVEDFKLSTHAYYLHEDIEKYDAQSIAYPLMVMNMYDCEAVTFRFRVYDKSNGTLKFNEFKRTKEECTKRLSVMYNSYIESDTFWEYAPNRTKKCFGMCWCKDKCPLFQK